MAESREHRIAKEWAADFLGGRTECRIRAGHRSDACGSYNGVPIYAEVDTCRPDDRGRRKAFIKFYDRRTHQRVGSFLYDGERTIHSLRRP